MTCDNGSCVEQLDAVTCNEAAQCQEPGFCDPDFGTCVYESRECAPTPIFLTVTQNGVAVGSVRCEVNGATIECDMRDEDGEQVLDVRPEIGVCGG